MMAFAQKALDLIRRDLPMISANAPVEVIPYSHLHIMTAQGGYSFEDAARAWASELMQQIDPYRPDWLWWRQSPEVKSETEFATNKTIWIITSRAVIPITRQSVMGVSS